MDIKEARKDLNRRQHDLADRLNKIIAQEQSLAREKLQVIEEIKANNGEARMLNRLSDNGKKAKQ